jgi:hypothetical protein
MCGCNKGRGMQNLAPVTNSNSILAQLRNRGNAAQPVPAAPAVASRIVNHMEPSRWGPPLWKMMHILAFASSELDVAAWTSLFQAIQNEIPCPVCQSHAQEWCKQNPDFTTMGIQQYLLNLHNHVNARRNVAQWNRSSIPNKAR